MTVLRGRLRRVTKTQIVVSGNAGTLFAVLIKARFEYGPVRFFPVPVAPGLPVDGLQVWLNEGRSSLFLCEVHGPGEDWEKFADQLLGGAEPGGGGSEAEAGLAARCG